MNKSLKILLSIPKTIWFNIRYLPFSQAIKLPIWISYDSYINIKGKVILESIKLKTAMIRIGFHWVPICERKASTQIVIKSQGMLLFKGEAHIGVGSKIHIDKYAKLILGDNFSISSCSQINCFYKIIFGDNIQFSWECLVMDSDTHDIFDEHEKRINPPKEIIFQNKIWIGCRSIILKGSILPSNTIIGAGSIVTGNKFAPNYIICGIPAKNIKRINRWEL